MCFNSRFIFEFSNLAYEKLLNILLVGVIDIKLLLNIHNGLIDGDNDIISFNFQFKSLLLLYIYIKNH